ncbi:MAG: hypothetical protein GEV13_09400 [Rhodospirillales bacterium]|nr:hypothetical protein [Rhodospirillales bacterium]
MTIIEAVAADRLRKPKSVGFGHYLPTVDGQRNDDPPEVAAAIEKAGSRVMSWDEALPALEALGSKRAADIVVWTTSGTMTVGHNGADWHIL